MIHEDIRNLEYSQIIMDEMMKINLISSSKYEVRSEKILDYVWAIRHFTLLVPESIRTNKFIASLKKIELDLEQMYKIENKQRDELKMLRIAHEMYFLCLQALGKGGFLYKQRGVANYQNNES